MTRHTFLVAMKRVATLGSIGYMPGSGTVATLVTLPAVAFLKYFGLSYRTELFIVLGATVLLTLAVYFALYLFPFTNDPRQIVADEVVGCLWTFCGTALTFKKLIWGFLFFRIFDIVKPFGIRSCEKAPGTWGIMLDDIVAGAYASLCLLIFFS